MKAALIKHIEKVVSLTDTEAGKVAGFFNVKKIKKRQFLVQSGEYCNQLNFVLKGCLRSYYINEQGDEYIVQFAIEDWWINDNESFFAGTLSIFNIEALEDSVLLQISKPSFEELLVEVPKMERFFRIIYQKSFISLQKRVIASFSQTADQRYAEYIHKYPKISNRVPQYHLAAYLGITPEHLSKIRGSALRKS